jgi:hypothetical protein
MEMFMEQTNPLMERGHLKSVVDFARLLWKYPDLATFFIPGFESERVGSHMDYYERLGEDMRARYGGKSGSVTDMAKNFGGAYDWVQRGIAPDDARTMAELYQWQQLQGKKDRPMTVWDTYNDYMENLAGIDAAAKAGFGVPRSYDDEREMAIGFANKNKRVPMGLGALFP